MSIKNSSFAPAFIFLSKEKKKALKSVYDFCRLVDDIADEPSQNPQKELLFWQTEIENTYLNKPSTFIGKNLLTHIRKFGLKKEHFMLVIEGVTQDLTKKRYSTFDELKPYLYRVASAVGFLCITILGYKNPKTEKYAKYTGYAVQLTNIIRDIFTDAQKRRVYIPTQDLDKFEVSEKTLLDCKMDTKIENLLKFQIDRAKSYYAKAKNMLAKDDFKNMFTARIMSSLYETLLKKIEKNFSRIAAKKIKLNKLEKMMAVLRP